MSKAGYKKGWNISNENLFEIYSFINNMKTSTNEQIRDKAILEYAFIHNMSAMQISEINDPRIVCFSNRSKNKPLSNTTISKIIKSYGLIHDKKKDYSNSPLYEKYISEKENR